MSNIETTAERGESKRLNTSYRLSRVGARIAGAALVLTGISVDGGSTAYAAKASSIGEIAQPVTPPNLIPGSHHPEITRDRSITFANYDEAASAGPILRRRARVLVNCVATDQQGDEWYLINYPEKGFAGYWDETSNFDNGYTGEAVVTAPTVDPRVPACPEPYEPTLTTPTTSPPSATTTPTTTPTYSETVGSVAHTWTDYSDAGGSEGASISAYQTIQIDCKVPGFKVSDGNTWWYRIASSPWNDNYYVSADAFYNDGATSGSLEETPFVDPGVRSC